MIRGASLRTRRSARHGGHSVVVERIAGDQFIPVATGGVVAPGETIRLFVSGVSSALIHAPEFIVTAPDGSEVLRREAGVTPKGEAWLDIQAPLIEGSYNVHAVPL